MYKRFQYYSKNGIIWTKWFKCNRFAEDKWQLKNKLLNEYLDVLPEDN